MPFTYNPNVPIPSNNPSQDVQDMQTNTASIAGWVAVDHVAFGPAQSGFHVKSTYPVGSAPSAVANCGIMHSESITYVSPVQTSPEAFWKGDGSTGSQNIQITNQSLVKTTGSGMLPGGLQIRSGTAGSNGAGIPTTFNPPFPTACISVVATGSDSAQLTNVIKVVNGSVSSTGFSLRSSQGAACFYVAIGY